tara:strand:- start:171 stop:1019 length:849 start_codon:yes stop_codon:yes gene_type:complete
MTTFAKAFSDVNLKHDQAGTTHNDWLVQRFGEVKETIKPEFHQAVELLSKQINSWAGMPHLEIEARLGYFDEDEQGNVNSRFDTDISQDWFNAIIKLLDEDPEILERENTVTTDYISGHNRLSVDTNSGSRSAMSKRTLEHSNFRYVNSPFDIRVSFALEKPIAIETFAASAQRSGVPPDSTKRKKTRRSYHMQNWRFDLTKVEQTKDGIQEQTFQIEIEAKLDSIKYVDYVYMADSLLLKIAKIVNVCEPPDPDEKRDMEPLGQLSKKYMSLEQAMASLSV